MLKTFPKIFLGNRFHRNGMKQHVVTVTLTFDLMFLLYLSLTHNIYLLLQNPDLRLLVVDLVTLFTHSFQQLHDALLLAEDHVLVRGKEN